MTAVGVDDFHFNCVIGKGTYAKVCLVIRKKDNKPFALKILKKKYIIEKHQVQHIMTEKRILAEIEHPFLVKLYSSFQDEKKLYFVLEYCPGGDLFGLLSFKDKLH